MKDLIQWHNLGLLICQVMFIKWAWMYEPNEWLLLQYACIVVYPKLLLKIVQLRVGNIGGAEVLKEKTDANKE